MYTLPNFNLDVYIWRNATNYLTDPPDNLASGNFSFSRFFHATLVTGITTPATILGQSFSRLLLPKLTDIRGSLSPSGPDWVEVPALSGRYYAVITVDDSGKGFDNEHRVAIVTQAAPYPEPLP